MGQYCMYSYIDCVQEKCFKFESLRIEVLSYSFVNLHKRERKNNYCLVQIVFIESLHRTKEGNVQKNDQLCRKGSSFSHSLKFDSNKSNSALYFGKFCVLMRIIIMEWCSLCCYYLFWETWPKLENGRDVLTLFAAVVSKKGRSTISKEKLKSTPPLHRKIL